MSSNIIQKRPNTVVHLKIDEAMESRRSYKEVRRRWVENLPYCLSGLLLARRVLKTVHVHVRSNTNQKLRLQNQMTDRLLTTE